MLKRFPLNCLKGFVFTCAFALATSTYAAQKQEPIDLSILEHRNSLAQTMNASQRIALLKLEDAVEKAASDIQTAQYMVETKPTAFRSQQEVQTIIKNGETLLKVAESELDRAQRELVDFLKTAETERSAQLAIAAKKFNFSLTTSTYEAAFEHSIRSLLNTARANGYKTVFFDTVFVSNETSTQAIAANARNDAYDQIVAIDATHFAVSVALDLHIDADSKLTFENIDDYKNDKLALMVIELIQQTEGEGLLSIRLIDVHSLHIISSELTHVTEVSVELLNEGATEAGIDASAEAAPESEAGEQAEATTTEAGESAATVAATSLPTGANITDSSLWIDRLAQQTYSFKVVTEGDASLIPSTFLMHTIKQSTTMKIVDDAFVGRAYGSDTVEVKVDAGAQLTITPEAESFKISAQSFGSDRTIEIGTMALTYE